MRTAPKLVVAAAAGRIDLTDDLKSDNWQQRSTAEAAKRESDAMLKCMSPRGKLKLPPLLEKRRLEYGITDGAFAQQPLFERIFVHQVETHGGPGGEGGVIIATANTEAMLKEQAPTGIIVAASLRARDYLVDHGADLGHLCAFSRIQPYRFEVDRRDGYSWYCLLMQVGDLVSSFDTRAMVLRGDLRVEYDEKQREHVYVVAKTGKRWNPSKQPFQGADS